MRGLGVHASEYTGAGGSAVGGGALGFGASGESLFVWDDFGNMGLADAWAWGGGTTLLGLQGGLAFQFTTAKTIFDLNGATPQGGVGLGAFGLNYMRGRNADGTSYWGVELVLGPSVGIKLPKSIPSGSFQSSTTRVIGLSDFFWDVGAGMNQFFSMQSPFP